MDYKTIAAEARAEYVEKRSKFIATVQPVLTESEAMEFIARIRGEFHDARHNVFSYLIKDGEERFSDDGEPQGTGGLPVLEVLRRREIVNAAVVVTRYFGGILLGAPGLVRAYAHAAALALDASAVVTMRHCDIIEFSCGYELYSRVDGLVRSFGGQVKDRDFNSNVILKVFIPKQNTKGFKKAITEMSAGTVETNQIGDTYIAAE
jgi:uncharacterized YigZ family protein